MTLQRSQCRGSGEKQTQQRAYRAWSIQRKAATMEGLLAIKNIILNINKPTVKWTREVS